MKILAIQNRMGIGDTVIFLPFVKSISKKFNSPVSLLVKENSKADQFLGHTKYIDKIIILQRNNEKNDRHDGIKGFFNLIKDLKNYDEILLIGSGKGVASVKTILQIGWKRKSLKKIT